MTLSATPRAAARRSVACRTHNLDLVFGFESGDRADAFDFAQGVCVDLELGWVIPVGESYKASVCAV
jgi:hypothetical protein